MGKMQLQEFFSSADSQEKLVVMLNRAGFKRVRDKTMPTFQTRDAFIQVQPIKGTGDHIAADTGHDYGFVMELYTPIQKLRKNSPVMVFFGGLHEACAHGLAGFPPKYGIRKYTGLN